jgi:sulfate permease, SulP family
MMSGAARVITDHGLNLSAMDSLLEPLALAKLGAGAVIAIALYLGIRERGNKPYVLPAILLAGIAVTHLVLALTGTTLAEARAAGWTFKAPAAVGLTPTWDFHDVSQFPWQVLPSLAGDLFAVMFVTAVGTLLNTTGVEFVTKREADLQRELTTIGAANLTAAALGGYANHHLLEPDHAKLCRRRPWAALRAHHGCRGRTHASGRSGLSRLCAEIRARRPAPLSRRRAHL